MAEDLEHYSVLPQEVAQFLKFNGNAAKMIDGTLGNGGHTLNALQSCPQLQVIGIDRDIQAIGRAAERLKAYNDRVILHHGVFSDMEKIAEDESWSGNVDAVLLDIGVSSPQLDDAARGFSWRMDGPLDMRMDRRSPLTASRILNQYEEADLIRIFKEYGELKQAKKLARRVVEEREKKLFSTTADLVDFCDRVLGKSRPGELPSPTLVFQALRIEVNDELGELKKGLAGAFNVLKNGGVLIVISFHSLEDRIVKRFFKRLSTGCLCPPSFPMCVCNHTPEGEILTRGVLVATPQELAENKRSCCAKLRAIRKIKDIKLDMTEFESL
ncbi:MAG: 16S rRNA (cytosine(1402)-N(4))-methyltransferase RsmH [Lentisphaeria bacterium]|nr:16S rRNA (cytosine(1402)-N(4))-methyltransferase RsmH [Lentisphaeria bacterium]